MKIDVAEKVFEDWVCENIQSFMGTDAARLIGRQVNLGTAGILDVLAVIESPTQIRLVVIELKARTIDESAVAQVLRYMGALEAGYPDRDLLVRRAGDTRPVMVAGVLAAPEIADGAALCLAALPHVRYTPIRAAIEVDPAYPPPHEGRVAGRPAVLNELASHLKGGASWSPLEDDDFYESIADGESIDGVPDLLTIHSADELAERLF